MTDEIKDIGSYPMEPLRMRYFAGQFLEAKDFTEEQAYHVERRRRLNRELFGRGVRRGFSVTMRIRNCTSRQAPPSIKRDPSCGWKRTWHSTNSRYRQAVL